MSKVQKILIIVSIFFLVFLIYRHQKSLKAEVYNCAKEANLTAEYMYMKETDKDLAIYTTAYDYVLDECLQDVFNPSVTE